MSYAPDGIAVRLKGSTHIDMVLTKYSIAVCVENGYGIEKGVEE